MNPAIKAFTAAFAALLLSGQSVRINAAEGAPRADAQTFDISHGVVLAGWAAGELAERCGAGADAKERTAGPAEIKILEEELAPLLADDLKNIGSTVTPHEYYRQYAPVVFQGVDAVVVNGFHEAYLSGELEKSWRHRTVSVADGGEHFWCAIYIPGVKDHFVTYQKPGGVTTHVMFHGLG
jgi:hypothetical protein